MIWIELQEKISIFKKRNSKISEISLFLDAPNKNMMIFDRQKMGIKTKMLQNQYDDISIKFCPK